MSLLYGSDTHPTIWKLSFPYLYCPIRPFTSIRPWPFPGYSANFVHKFPFVFPPFSPWLGLTDTLFLIPREISLNLFYPSRSHPARAREVMHFKQPRHRSRWNGSSFWKLRWICAVREGGFHMWSPHRRGGVSKAADDINDKHERKIRCHCSHVHLYPLDWSKVIRSYW